MTKWQLACGGALTAWCVSAQALTPPDSGYDDKNTQYGTYLQFGLPLLGLGLTFLLTPNESGDSGRSYSGAYAPGFFGGEGDSGWLSWNHMNGSPGHDFWLAFGRMEVVTYALKYTVPSKRPNGAPHSFPSGHTSAAFMGAEFIRKEYGWWWGAPSYLAASYVGWTRQQSRNHYTRDVLAGALIGILSNHDLSEFTTPAGNLGLGVSMLSANPALWRANAYDDLGALDDNVNPRQADALVPALSLHLSF